MSVRIALERPPFQDEIDPSDAAVETLSEGAADFTEGPAAGPDGRIYFSDRESRVFAYDLNDTGTVGGRHLLVDLGDLGHPDGMTVDVEGFLSVAVASRRRADRDARSGDKRRIRKRSRRQSSVRGGGIRPLPLPTCAEGFSLAGQVGCGINPKGRVFR